MTLPAAALVAGSTFLLIHYVAGAK
jgi:hypothetical protein